MLRIAQQLMVRCLVRVDKVDRQQGNPHRGREALRRGRKVLSIKNMTALPQGKARPVKADLREPEYRNRREQETLGTLHRAGGPKHQDRKEAPPGINTRAKSGFTASHIRPSEKMSEDRNGLFCLLQAAAENG